MALQGASQGMSFIQLHDPPECDTEKGRGFAHFAIDYGPNANVLFGVVLSDSGQLWWVPTHKLTIAANWSLGQHGTKKIPEGSVPLTGGGMARTVPPKPVGPKDVLASGLAEPRTPRDKHGNDH